MTVYTGKARSRKRMNAFNSVYDSVTSAHAAGDYAAALRAAREGHDQLAGERVRTWYWQACLLGLLGDPGAAIAALEAGLDEGGWFDPEMLDLDPDLQAVRSLPGLPADPPRMRRAQEPPPFRRPSGVPRTLPVVGTLGPADADGSPQAGDSARHFADRWGALVDEGWTLVVPQSSQPWDSAGWCWDDVDRARGEVRAHLEDCRSRRGLDLSRLVIAGASQGAPLAAELAQEAGLPWLCVIPSFPSGYDAARLAGVLPEGRRNALLGKRDLVPARHDNRRQAADWAGAHDGRLTAAVKSKTNWPRMKPGLTQIGKARRKRRNWNWFSAGDASAIRHAARL